ncbi:MAG TPA: hypothetical protein VH374_12860 [Polyangia bacterium]|jgi:hypothetical protein|nr:hypothetical protein [Polyangia bacterium]
MRPFAAVVSLAFLFSAGAGPGATAVHAAGKERQFSSSKYGLSVDAPPGWELSVHTGYPNILAVLLHPNGSRISLSAAETKLRDARDAAEQNRPGLQAQGLTVLGVTPALRGGAILDAQSNSGKERVRQIYLVRTAEDQTRQIVVVTLTAPRDLLATMSLTLEQIASRVAAESPPPSATPPVPPPGAARGEKIPAAPAPH